MTSDLFPGRAFIARHVKPASGAATFAAPGVNLNRPHPRKQDPRIARVHHHVRTATVFVHEQDAIPMRAAVRGAKDATLGLWPIRMSYRTGQDDIRILRIDDNMTYATGLFQAHQLPGFPRVSRFVNSLSD